MVDTTGQNVQCTQVVYLFQSSYLLLLFIISIHYLLFAVQPWGVYVVHPTIVFPVNLFNQHKLKLYNVDKRMPRMLYLQCTSCIVGAFISF